MKVSSPLGLILASFLSVSSAHAQEERLDVAFLVWDGMELIESMGPAHVFSFAPGMDEFTVSKDREPIRSEFVTIVPDYSLDDCPDPDVIVIPGGSIWTPRSDSAYRDWLRRHVPKGKLTVSVCNSAILLADLGLLDGHEATCGKGNLDDLMLLGDDVRAYHNRRWVHSGNIITSESYLGGLDAAIYAVRVLRGPEGEKQVLAWSNYDGDLSSYDAMHAEPGLIPVSRRREIVEILERDGVDAAVERFHEWVASGQPAYDPPMKADESSMFQWMAWGHQRLGEHELSLKICTFKTRIWPDSAKERAYLGEAQMKAGRIEKALGALLDALDMDPTDRRALILLKELLGQRELEPSEATRCGRELLRKQASSSTATVTPEGEPGTPLTVEGTVRDGSGEPITGARLHVFQADADGHYTRQRVMDEPNARLFAYLRTARDGTYRLETIRPGHYPGRPERQGVQWEIPAHVHFEITAEGFQPRRFQMVFEDDPRMEPDRWKQWAKKGNHPIVSVTTDESGRQRCTCDIVLERD